MKMLPPRRVPVLAIVLLTFATACSSAITPTENPGEARPPTGVATTGDTPKATNPTTSVASGAPVPVRRVCPAFDADWPLSGRDLNNTSNNTAEDEISVQSVAGLVEVWRHEDNGGVSGTPIIVAGTVFYGDWNGFIHAADACTGEFLWSTNVSDRPVAASVAVGRGLVIGSDVAGGIHALSQEDGAIVWSGLLGDTDGTSGFGPPTIVGDVIISGVSGGADPLAWRGSIVAHDLATGDELWRTFTDNGLASEGGSVAVWSSASIDTDRGLVYIGTGNTNRVRNDGEPVPESPYANAVMALDIESGAVAWVTRIIDDDDGRDLDIGAPPNLFSADGNDLVAVGGKSGDFFALDRDTGAEVWRVTLTPGSRAGGVMKGAALADGVLYVASNAGFLADGNVIALDVRTGDELWRSERGAALIGHAMSTANDVVFATWYDGAVTAIDAATGDELWSSSLDGVLQGGVSIADGFIFVGFGGGQPPDLRPTRAGGIVAFSLSPG